MADEILIYYEQVVATLTLVPSNEGRFEVKVNGELIFSKLNTGRHVRPGEVVELLKDLAVAAEQAERLGF